MDTILYYKTEMKLIFRLKKICYKTVNLAKKTKMLKIEKLLVSTFHTQIILFSTIMQSDLATTVSG